MKRIAPVLLLLAGTMLAGSAGASGFVPGNLVVSVEGKGASSGTYTDNQAAPMSLFQYTTSGQLVNTMQISPSNFSGEYGSSSEGALQLTGDGKHLVIMGYGVNAAAFNSAPFGTYQNTVSDPKQSKALGQSSSIACGVGCTPVPRVVAVIGADGSVDTSTRITGVFNGNNPRSVASPDGKTFYISGQGTGNAGDGSGGVFITTLGSTTATSLTGLDTQSGSKKSSPFDVGQDTRFVSIFNNQLYVSVDSKEGSNNNRDFIATVGTGLPDGTTTGAPQQLKGFGNSGGTGKVIPDADQTNGIAPFGEEVNLSPEAYVFADNGDVLYVADSGIPKNDSATNDAGSTLGDGGLQKWSLVNGTWQFDYILYQGLNLVPNTAASGTTGLLGLTGEQVGGEEELFATNFTIGDTDPTFLYGIIDQIDATSLSQLQTPEVFQELAAAPADSNFKGVSFAPTPEPATWGLMLAGFGLLGGTLRRQRRSALA